MGTPIFIAHFHGNEVYFFLPKTLQQSLKNGLFLHICIYMYCVRLDTKKITIQWEPLFLLPISMVTGFIFFTKNATKIIEKWIFFAHWLIYITNSVFC